MIVDLDDWGELFTPSPEPQPDPNEYATRIQRGCQSGRDLGDTLILAFRLTTTGTSTLAAPVQNVPTCIRQAERRTDGTGT